MVISCWLEVIEPVIEEIIINIVISIAAGDDVFLLQGGKASLNNTCRGEMVLFDECSTCGFDVFYTNLRYAFLYNFGVLEILFLIF